MPRKSMRTNVTKACDVCRIRKVKCEPSGAQIEAIPTCKACLKEGLQCTYHLPVSRRGPPSRRQAQPYTLSSPASSDQSPGRDSRSFQSLSSEVQTPTDVTFASPSSYGTSPKSTSTLPNVQESSHERSFLETSPAALPVDDRLPRNAPSETPAASLWTSPALSRHYLPPIIYSFCSQAILDAAVKDYLKYIYPLIPVVHIPSFLADLSENQHASDLPASCLLISLCALVISKLPRRFESYGKLDASFKSAFGIPRQMVQSADAFIQTLKQPDFHNTLTVTKWATAALLSMSNLYVGLRNRGTMHRVEANKIMLNMQFHRISSYSNLNNVESQLRKKAFWITVTLYVHVKILDASWGSLNERFTYENADAEALEPLEVDDEFITKEAVFDQPSNKPSLMVGFNAEKRLMKCLVSITRDLSVPVVTTCPTEEQHEDFFGKCDCGRLILPAPKSLVAEYRLRNLNYMLDDLPPQLSLWQGLSVSADNTTQDSLRTLQFEIQRANIHVTHLWMQSFLIDRLSTMSIQSHSIHASLSGDNSLNLTSIWDMRENMFRQLLHILDKILEAYLEVNGYELVVKIRQIAATLLDYPSDGNDDEKVSRRARTYLQKFTDIPEVYRYSRSLQICTPLDHLPRSGPARNFCINSALNVTLD